MIISDFNFTRIKPLDRIEIRALSSFCPNNIIVHLDRVDHLISTCPCHRFIGVNCETTLARPNYTNPEIKSICLFLIAEGIEEFLPGGILKKVTDFRNTMAIIMLVPDPSKYEIINQGRLLKEEQLTHSNEHVRGFKC